MHNAMTAPDNSNTSVDIDIPQRLQAAKLGMLVPRAIAHTIDIVVLIGTFVSIGKLMQLGQKPSDGLFLLGCLAAFSYFLISEWRWGKTIGKRLIGLAVVNCHGHPISFGQSLGRNLIRLLEASVGPPCFIGVAFILFTKDSQRLGDLAAETYVVPTTLLSKRTG